ncbi:MAG: TonB-dependent receptor [Candidatus Kapaibacteriota bacterium]
MKKYLIALAIFLFMSNLIFAKEFTLIGTVIDNANSKPLPSATVTLHSKKDSSIVKGEYTDSKGKFKIENIPMGGYFLKISFVGYKTKYEEVRPAGKDLLDLGDIVLETDAIQMKSVEVVDNMVRAEMKDDTTQYNAKAFKTQPNAQAEELVKKIPGVQIESTGNIKAQGEDVKEVLVNGRQYFGDDPSIAMKNLPADVIDKVQIFDKMSDQAQFTGFDDGSRFKAMNLLTKNGTMTFGKIYGGYGVDNKYSVGGTWTLLKGDTRLSILGMSNNINQINFNFQDIIGIFGDGHRPSLPNSVRNTIQSNRQFIQRPSGGGGGSPFGDFFIGNLNGISQTHALGVNYVDVYSKIWQINASYFANYTDNDNNEFLNRQYFVQSDTNFFYLQNSINNSKTFNQRINVKLQADFDSSNAIIWRPTGSIQNTKFNYNVISQNNSLLNIDTTIMNKATSLTNSNYYGYNLNSNLLIQHKFELKGRTISLNINNQLKLNSGDSYLDSYYSDYFTQIIQNDTLNQLNNTVTNGQAHSANLMYTEPIGDFSQLSLSYNPGYNVDKEDRGLFQFNPLVKAYNVLDSALSNYSTSKTFYNKFGLGYMINYGILNANLNLNYQLTNFNNEKDKVNPFSLERSYKNFLPSLMLSLKFNKLMNLRTYISTSTQIPTIAQLSPVVNNSNPLQLTTGNPNLNQQTSLMLFTRFFAIHNDNRNTFFIMAYYSQTKDYISNMTLITPKDTVINNYLVQRGTQILIPKNFGNAYTARTFTTYGLPVDFISSNLNINAGFTYNQTPGNINLKENTSKNYSYNIGLDLNSNISEFIDFSIGSTAIISQVRNSVQTALNNDYNNINSYARISWTVWQGFYTQLEIYHNYSSGYSQGYNKNLLITNITIGNRALYKNNFDFKLQVFDLFDKNNTIQRNVTDAYFEDVQSLTLKRYGLLTLTYYIRPF